MSTIVIKTIGGRQYRYLQRSYRDGASVRTASVYLGPVDGGRRKGLLRRIGELIDANRAEPGTRLINQMIDEAQKQAAAREAAKEKAGNAFYTKMHDLYGMTKPGTNPAVPERPPSPAGTSAPAVTSEVVPAATESPSATEGASSAEAAPSE